MFESVQKQSLSESVYRQLKHKIVAQELAAGAALPSERMLGEMLGVNRGAVREAIKRLQQAGLVGVRHGGNHVVLDYQQEAGLELLPSLIVDAQGTINPQVVRAIMSLRAVLAPEIAAVAAAQGGIKLAAALDVQLERMRAADLPTLPTLQALALEYWGLLVDATGNIAFRLAFNSMNKSYRGAWDLLRGVLEPELRDLDGFAALVAAVRKRDAEAARASARTHVAIGSRAMDRVLAKLPKKNPMH